MVNQMHIECARTKKHSDEFLQGLPQIIIKKFERDHIIRKWEGLAILILSHVCTKYHNSKSASQRGTGQGPITSKRHLGQADCKVRCLLIMKYF